MYVELNKVRNCFTENMYMGTTNIVFSAYCSNSFLIFFRKCQLISLFQVQGSKIVFKLLLFKKTLMNHELFMMFCDTQ